MLRVLLADTDADNIKNFRTYIRLAFPDIKVTGSLTASTNFINHVKELAPQLIIADIRFFGTQAYQLIRDTYEFFPDKRFILYGTYNDTEYMERVFEFGVIDYIYRPVKPSDLEKSLHHALKTFEEMSRTNEAKNKLISDYKVNISMFTDKFLESLTRGYLSEDSEILDSFKYFGLGLEPGYSVFTVRIDHFKRVIMTMDEMEKHLLVYKILLIIVEKLRVMGSGVPFVNRLNTISVILGGSLPLYETIELCDTLRQDILYHTKVGVTIGVGRIYDRPTDIAVSFRESEAAIRYKYYVGTSTVIPIHFVEPRNNITYRYPLEKEERLVYAAVTGEYESCSALLSQIFESLKACGELPDKLIAKIIMDILFSISRFASEQHIQIESEFTNFFSSKNVIELKTLDEAYEYMNSALQKFCSYMVEIRGENNAQIVDKVKRYIDERYYENISLSKMAIYAETTPEFLSNLFMKSEKVSLYQYAISVRLHKAKELLIKTNLRYDTIAEKVGYGDSKHFDAIFKQHEGVTTAEYRARHRLKTL